MSKKPFIIKSRVMEPMIPQTSELYDDTQESRIQIVQAANGYLAVLPVVFRLACCMRVSS